MDYSWHHGSAQYSPAVDEWLKNEYGHLREVLAWEKPIRDLELKLSAAVTVEAQTRERNNEFAVRPTCEDTRRLRVSDARACIVTAKNGLGTSIENVLVWTKVMIGKLQEDLASLFRTGARVACERRIDPPVADFTAASVAGLPASGSTFLSTAEASLARIESLMDLNLVSSESVPAPTEVKVASVIERQWLISSVTRVRPAPRCCML